LKPSGAEQKPTAGLVRNVESIPKLQVPLPTPPGQRRKSLFARFDRDSAAMAYSEGWRQKIETSAPPDLLKSAKAGAVESSLVTVALRFDGSVESVTINRSGGVLEVDEAIRRTIYALAPYQPFPPGMAQDYDIVEIRRVWTFDTALRLFAGGK